MAPRLSAAGRLCVSIAADGSGRLWDAETGKAVATLKWDGRPVRSAAFSGDGQWMLTTHHGKGGKPPGVRLWPLDLLGAAHQRRVRDFTAQERDRYPIDSEANGDPR